MPSEFSTKDYLKIVLPISVYQPRSAWRSVVVRKRQEVLENHLQNIPENVASTGNDIWHPTINDIKIMDKQYFEKMWESPQWQVDIDSIAKEYTLNPTRNKHFALGGFRPVPT